MKTLLKWSLCSAAAVLILAAGSKLIQDNNIKISDIPMQTAIAQTASENVLLVSASNPLPDGFETGGLVDLYDEKRTFQLASSDIRLTRETFEAANDMFGQARKDGISGFILTSGYRTEAEQRELYKNGADKTAAVPGASEHQTGLAFDVTAYSNGKDFDETEQFSWLNEHCWDFGFILRYPEGKEDITGFPYESWHYRYVGVEIAQKIHENGWTLEEYCERNGD